MTRLITGSTIREFKGLSANVNEAKELNPHIDEAQEFDLSPWLGQSFYLDLIAKFDANSTDPDFLALMNETVYTYESNNYKSPGINKVLAYLSSARYSVLANAQSTPTGFVQKTNQYSTPISGSQITRIVKQNESGANTLQKQVEDFLNRNSDKYPLWKVCKSGGRKKSIRINKIG